MKRGHRGWFLPSISFKQKGRHFTLAGLKEDGITGTHRRIIPSDRGREQALTPGVLGPKSPRRTSSWVGRETGVEGVQSDLIHEKRQWNNKPPNLNKDDEGGGWGVPRHDTSPILVTEI